MGVLSNKIDREQLKLGDHIYSWRLAYVYAHHGIYVGEGKVIHFTQGAGQEIGTGTFLDRIITSSSPAHLSDTPCPQCGDSRRLDGVILSCVDCFLSGGNPYRFEYGVSRVRFLAQARGGTCTRAKSDPPEDVIHRANLLLKNGFGGYHVFKNNCEDFAIYCKTGLIVIAGISVGQSGQTASLVAAASAIVSPVLKLLIPSFSGIAFVSYTYCESRLTSDIGVRSNMEKVAVERLVANFRLGDSSAANDISREE
ncbi:hypothetical protein ACOSQ3_026901 [Xanthoceras sorbifolium]